MPIKHLDGIPLTPKDHDTLAIFKGDVAQMREIKAGTGLRLNVVGTFDIN